MDPLRPRKRHREEAHRQWHDLLHQELADRQLHDQLHRQITHRHGHRAPDDDGAPASAQPTAQVVQVNSESVESECAGDRGLCAGGPGQCAGGPTALDSPHPRQCCRERGVQVDSPLEAADDEAQLRRVQVQLATLMESAGRHSTDLTKDLDEIKHMLEEYGDGLCRGFAASNVTLMFRVYSQNYRIRTASDIIMTTSKELEDLIARQLGERDVFLPNDVQTSETAA